MSSIVISGDTSGAITLAAPAVAGTNTATLPAAAGTVMVSGNMPAFSAYSSTNQSISNSTFTKITFDTEEFDTNNNFASSRFTPTVAGYYQINSLVFMSTGAYNQIALYKNGTGYKYGSLTGNGGYLQGFLLSALVYLNGSTDYVEIYYQQSSGGSLSTLGSQTTVWFQGSMIRTA